MQTRLIIFSVLFLLSSCTERQNDQLNQTPNPIEVIDNKSLSDKIKSRGKDDYLENLYEEILRTDSSTSYLENMFKHLNDSQNDSLETFNDYQAKNAAYYQSAKSYASNIDDSTLKRYITKMIADSDTLFKQHIKTHTDLVQKIRNQDRYIYDLHYALKIYATLPLIQQYQETKKPGVAALKDYLEQQESFAKKIEATIKK